MITGNNMSLKKIALAIIIFLFGFILLFLVGKHLSPFISWLFDFKYGLDFYLPVECVVFCTFIVPLSLSFIKKQSKKLFIFLWASCTIGSILGSLVVWLSSSHSESSFECGYSKTEIYVQDNLKRDYIYKIGLINKWGVEVVPQTCDFITLITEDATGEDAFLGFIENDDSLKVYYYADSERGLFKEIIALDSLKRINSYVEKKYGNVKANYFSWTMSKAFKHFEKNYIEKENYSENHKEAIDVDDSHHNLNNTDNVVTPEQQTIVVEHKYQPRIVQKWQNCGGCGGSTLCGTCGGSGRNPFSSNPYEECPQCYGNRKCTMCGGRGGYYYEAYE